jgi:hypothetical protein
VALKLPPMGPAARRTRIPPGEGRPEPASIEPSPLEVAEQRRGERDDVVRESMAAQALQGRSEGLAPDQYEPVETVQAGDAQIKLWRLLSGQFHYADMSTGQVANAEATLLSNVEVKEGMRFIVRHINVLAPKGSKLRIYLNSVVPANFLEVITNVQEFSGEPPGCLWIEGPGSIVPVIVGAEAAGQAVVRFEGDLAPNEYLSW